MEADAPRDFREGLTQDPLNFVLSKLAGAVGLGRLRGLDDDGHTSALAQVELDCRRWVGRVDVMALTRRLRGKNI